MREELFPPDTPFRMAVPIEVRFRDLDAMGHVNNAVYFTYFEHARLHYLRRLAEVPPPLEPLGMIVAEATCQYRAPITLGMPLRVWIRVGEIRQRSFVFLYRIERCDTGQVMALGRSVQVAYDYARGVSVPIPEPWRERFRAFEEGQLELAPLFSPHDPMGARMIIVDAHEDLAWNARSFGRDYTRSAHETRQREEGTEIPRLNGRCMLGLPEWLAGRVAVIFATVFVMPARHARSAMERTYRTPDEAYAEGMAQLDYYERLTETQPRFRWIRSRRDLEAVLETWREPLPEPDPRCIGIVCLMEGADPIRRPEEVEVWYERGVRIIGPAWSATRYAGGTGEPGPLTDEGRRLLKVMQDFPLILDLSHMAERSFFEALERYERPVIASHSNPQALVPGDRQLSDAMIRALAERDGVIGVVLSNRMLKKGWTRGDPKEAVTVWDVVRAIDYICQRVGDARHVGIGSDFDGGFGADETPAEFDTVADLPKIADALRQAGFAEADVEAVMGGNWLRILRHGLE